MKNLTIALLIASGLWWGGQGLAANPVQQSGNVTPGHVPIWVAPSVVKDGGPATQGAITELGITKNGGLPFCIVTGPTSSPGYAQLCLGVSLNGAGFISLTPYGNATSIPLNLIIDGVTYSIGGGGNWLSPIFDQQFGSAVGDMLCRSGSGWVALQPGASGQVLTSVGSAGCASWAGSGGIVGPVVRKVTSGANDTATTADGTVAWNSSTASGKAETIYACSAGVQGRTLTIVDQIGTASKFFITITPASGTIDNGPSVAISTTTQGVTVQCDGGSNWVVI